MIVNYGCTNLGDALTEVAMQHRVAPPLLSTHLDLNLNLERVVVPLRNRNGNDLSVMEFPIR